MYIAYVPNRKSPPAILLRESYRENGKVKSRTLANLSKLPAESIEVLRRSLKGEQMVPSAEAFEVLSSPHHGHVEAVLFTMRRLDLARCIDSRSSPQRDLVLAMIAARILAPNSKLATTRWWQDTTLPAILGVEDADEDDLYAALDWLLERQERIEKKLAARHLDDDSLVLYDLSSSYFEGSSCPLAAFGHNRDGKKGKLQVNYGLLTNAQGIPVSVSVFKGNTADPKTLLIQVRRVRETFDIERFVIVGDRGMITQKQIDSLQTQEGIEWITALRSDAIRQLIDNEALQIDLFDERNLFELSHPDFPGERLVACRNPQLAKRRGEKRRSLLEATAKELDKVCGMVERGRLKGEDKIGVRVGKVINKYKVAKHFILDIKANRFVHSLDEDQIAAEASLDGLYVIRTSLDKQHISAEDAVRNYKRLSNVERAFRSMKTMDLHVRPIHHRLEGRVRAHIFLCMLAYYVLWHMVDAWRELLFCDEDQDAKTTRDPVAPATRSPAALHKVHTRTLDDGTEAHSFQTLLHHLSTIVRNECKITDAAADAPHFEITTTPNAKQQRAYELLKTIAV
ncbi:MAG: IS1634 family transposase [Proteobacteria bacterium]|nr:IS1634 family transposase [Pseudomonadota bacterium]